MTYLTLPEDVVRDLSMFGKYLAEQNSERVRDGDVAYGFWVALCEQIDQWAKKWDWPDRSRLTSEKAGRLSRSLGEKLVLIAQQHIIELCKGKEARGLFNHDDENLDWHEFVRAGELCQLGHDICYFDGDTPHEA